MCAAVCVCLLSLMYKVWLLDDCTYEVGLQPAPNQTLEDVNLPEGAVRCGSVRYEGMGRLGWVDRRCRITYIRRTGRWRNKILPLPSPFPSKPSNTRNSRLTPPVNFLSRDRFLSLSSTYFFESYPSTLVLNHDVYSQSKVTHLSNRKPSSSFHFPSILSSTQTVSHIPPHHNTTAPLMQTSGKFPIWCILSHLTSGRLA